MEGFLTLVIIVIWVILGLLNLRKKRSETMGQPGPRPRPLVPPQRQARPPAQRPVPPQPRRPVSTPVFTPKREEAPGTFPRRQAAPARREVRVPKRPPLPQTLTEAVEQLFGPPPQEVIEPEVATPPPTTPRPRKRVPPKAERRPPERRLGRIPAEVPQERFRFSDNLIINGIVFSELFGPPLAKRPHRQRRMF